MKNLFFILIMIFACLVVGARADTISTSFAVSVQVLPTPVTVISDPHGTPEVSVSARIQGQEVQF